MCIQRPWPGIRAIDNNLEGGALGMTELFGDSGALSWVAVKAVLMFAVAVAGFRLGERRTLAELGVFDFVVAVAAGALVGRTSTSSTTSFANGAVALATLLVAHRLVAAGRRHSRLGRLIDQPPRLLIAHGAVQDAELARTGLTVADVATLLRQRGVVDLDQVAYLLYEARGAVTLIRTGEPSGPLLDAGLAAAGHPDAPRQPAPGVAAG
jgi:uncharacterized membrane protein YcaP (DUF421 family)